MNTNSFTLVKTTFIAIIALLIIPRIMPAQTDWEKWGKADVSYEIKKNDFPEETKHENTGIAGSFLSVLRSVYAFFISDVDGDNCPFYPSCSNFYVKAVGEEGIIKGTLMFADRFTRDMNILKSRSHYPLHISGRFFDPTVNYSLSEDKIIYFPSETMVKNNIFEKRDKNLLNVDVTNNSGLK